MGQIRSCSGGQDHANKSLIQLSANGWGCTLSLLVGLRQPTPGIYRLYGGATGELQKDLCQHAPARTPAARATVPGAGYCRPMPQQETLKCLQVGLAQPSMGSLLLSPGS